MVAHFQQGSFGQKTPSLFLSLGFEEAVLPLFTPTCSIHGSASECLAPLWLVSLSQIAPTNVEDGYYCSCGDTHILKEKKSAEALLW